MQRGEEGRGAEYEQSKLGSSIRGSTAPARRARVLRDFLRAVDGSSTREFLAKSHSLKKSLPAAATAAAATTQTHPKIASTHRHITRHTPTHGASRMCGSTAPPSSPYPHLLISPSSSSKRNARDQVRVVLPHQRVALGHAGPPVAMRAGEP